MPVQMKPFKRRVFKKLGILAIYLFGSRAEGTAMDGSDIDVGIVFKKPMMPEDTRPLYHRIYSELSKIFQTSFTKDLDLVFLQKASLPLQYNAIINGSVLYEDDPVERADYEEAVARQYMDFKPILEYFDTISMERYA
jgi:predicted nucleotidyltransferase